MKKFRRIGILTSGGDAPGMNAAIRSVVRSANSKGIEVMGIYSGYKGLIENDMKLLTSRDVSNIINHGGTMLYSDRCDLFRKPEGMVIAKANCEQNKIDGIVAIGGDGTFRGATDLSRHGIPAIGIPGTIDRDISATDYTIGYDTAKDTVMRMVDRLRDTCESHARCNVVEVMGRNAGYIALDCGIATGAVDIGIKELPFDKEALIERMKKLHDAGKRNFIVIMSEGCGGEFNEKLAEEIQEKTGIDTRFARLAHVQRGGSPTVLDRVIATEMGNKAVELLLEGKYNLVVCYNKGHLTSCEMEHAFILDRVVKGKATDEEIAALSEDERLTVMQEAAYLHDEMVAKYELSQIMSI